MSSDSKIVLSISSNKNFCFEKSLNLKSVDNRLKHPFTHERWGLTPPTVKNQRQLEN